jgi:protein-S-isoprenylcysteine O-methyltransferase Ste14
MEFIRVEQDAGRSCGLMDRRKRLRELWENIMELGRILLSLVAHLAQLCYSPLLWVVRLCFLSQIIITVSVALKGIHPVMFVGIAVFLFGLAFVLWSRSKLTSRGGAVRSLITDGPYAVIRHPMYTGWNVMNLGLYLISRHWVVLLLAFFQWLVFYAVICEEDQVNREVFGKEYSVYFQNVPRASLVKGLLLRCFHNW